jgi:hypothetical protein
LEPNPKKGEEKIMRKLFIVLACFGLVFMMSNHLVASGGGGGGGGGGGDGSPEKVQPSLFPDGWTKNPSTKAEQEKQAAEETRQWNAYEAQKETRFGGWLNRYCFIDTASQDNWIDVLLDFIWKPKTE